MNWTIHHRIETASTNLDAREGRPGDVFTADFQSAGRGRLDHKWISPPGTNLMFSAVLDVADIEPQEVATLPLAVGLAIANTVQALVPGEVKLKWPNDVFIDGHKVCGILCERHGDNVIAGVGINVNQREFPQEIRNTATSLLISGSVGEPLEIEQILMLALRNLAEVYDIWKFSGFSLLYRRFEAIDFLKGREVSVIQTDDDQSPVRGICGGIQPDGTLLVGSTPIYAGEAHVSL